MPDAPLSAETAQPCEWCSGRDAEGLHENGCRLGLGPDEVQQRDADLDVIVRALIVARQRQGLSQRDVVRLIGCSTASVSNWERGTQSPGLSHLRTWAKSLGFDLTLSDREAH